MPIIIFLNVSIYLAILVMELLTNTQTLSDLILNSPFHSKIEMLRFSKLEDKTQVNSYFSIWQLKIKMWIFHKLAVDGQVSVNKIIIIIIIILIIIICYIYIALYWVLKVLYMKGVGGFPQPPPMWSIHLDDATASTWMTRWPYCARAPPHTSLLVERRQW